MAPRGNFVQLPDAGRGQPGTFHGCRMQYNVTTRPDSTALHASSKQASKQAMPLHVLLGWSSTRIATSQVGDCASARSIVAALAQVCPQKMSSGICLVGEKGRSEGGGRECGEGLRPFYGTWSACCESSLASSLGGRGWPAARMARCPGVLASWRPTVQ
ncbi:hypothetical protein N431DRAFT_205165 [Stipitochalara longipes BDJ]|nr:hypothetical protein N431DRAFT_205165 [Stipitochalara longipes BDJ]